MANEFDLGIYLLDFYDQHYSIINLIIVLVIISLFILYKIWSIIDLIFALLKMDNIDLRTVFKKDENVDYEKNFYSQNKKMNYRQLNNNRVKYNKSRRNINDKSAPFWIDD